MHASDSHPPGRRKQRRYLRDFAALTALPAVWSSAGRPQIGANLADVLVRLLLPEFVYVRLRGTTGQEAIEIVRCGQGSDSPERREAIRAAVEPWLPGGASATAVFSLALPPGEGSVQAAAIPIGAACEFGVLVAASGQPGFPAEEDRLLLGVAANQAAIVLQRQQAEEALRRSEQELADFFENAAVGLHWTGPDGTILRVNQAELDLLGYRREEYLGHHIAEFHADKDVIADILGQLASGKTIREYEARLRCKDGSIKHVLMNSNVLWENGQFIHTRSFTRDITDRRLAEDALRKQSEWLRITLTSIGDAVITTDTAGRVTSLNPVAESLTGWGQREAQGQPLATVFRIINEQNRRSMEDPATRALQEGQIVGLANQTLLIARDGTERAIDDSAAPIKDERGNFVGAVLIFRDVTETRRALELRLRLSAIVESSDDAIISKDLDGIIVSWNQAAERLYGYTAAEIVGQPLSLLVPPDHPDELPAIMERLRRGERIEHYETVRVRKDGGRVDVSLTISPVKGADGKIIGASKIARDITARKQAEEALRQSEAQFHQLADALPQIVWTARPDGFVDYYNERWYEFTGFRRGESGDQSWIPALHPDDVQRCLDTYYRCIRSGNVYQIEYRFKDRSTGGYRWFLGRAYPVRDQQNRITRWFGTCTDIDDTKRAEQTTRFLAEASAALVKRTDYESALQQVARLAVPSFADWCAVDVLQPDGSVRRLAVTHTDPAKQQLAHELLCRYPSFPADPRKVGAVLGTGRSEWGTTIPDSMLAEFAQDEEHLRILRGLGLKSYICTPLRSPTKTLGVLTFVTAESGRTYGAEDLRAAEDLADRAAIAVENVNLLRALKEADRRKDEFLATLAHEMRNPLAPIRNAVQILRAKGPPVPELQWARDVIGRQVQQMTRLVDDLLDVSRIGTGKIELRKERVELRTIVNTAVEASAPLIEKWNHQLTVTLPPGPVYLEVDPARLVQVLLNLLNNAAKYTPQGGRIELTAQREGEHVVIRVKDTGVGIPQEMLPHIFKMFTQVDRSLERSQGGLGIGLTLVQSLVAMHGGTVEAHSAGPGKGSEFVVRLPVAGEAEARGPQQTAGDSKQATAPARQRILVVDDNRDSADSLAMLLRVMGNEVQTAHDGLEAVRAAAAFLPDVVLLDIGLPKMNGYEAGRRIREQRGKEVVLVALTGWGAEEDRRQSREAGFDHHMTKPVEVDALQELLAGLKEAP
jgi:PAS domain S-box-containing protein